MGRNSKPKNSKGPRKCSKCKREVRGHAGPCGLKCNMSVLSEVFDQEGQHASTPGQPQHANSMTSSGSSGDSQCVPGLFLPPSMDLLKGPVGLQNTVTQSKPTTSSVSQNLAMGLPLHQANSAPVLTDHQAPAEGGSSVQGTSSDINTVLLQHMADLTSKFQQLAVQQQWLQEKLTDSILQKATVDVIPKAPAIADLAQPGHNIIHGVPVLQTCLPQPGGSIHVKPGIPVGLRDDVASIGDLRSIAPIEGIPESTIKSALNGEFVYLDHFLLNVTVSQETLGELQQYVDADGQVSYKPRRSKRRISNLQSWLEAWSNYEKLMISYHGIQLYDTMWKYRNFITECDRKYNWPAVAVYDIRHRADMSRKSVDFSQADHDLMSQILDSTAIKANAPRCFRCKSFLHTVNECPFPQVAPKAPQTKNKRAENTSNQNSAICRNFNSLRCVLTSCPRRHECRSCHGDLPYDLCIKSGPCSGGQVPTQT